MKSDKPECLVKNKTICDRTDVNNVELNWIDQPHRQTSNLFQRSDLTTSVSERCVPTSTVINLFPYLFLLFYFKPSGGSWSSSQSEKTCKRPDALPPSKAFLVGWKAVTDSTVLRFSASMKECCSWPFSLNTCILRGLPMLPTTKQSSCFGSHTADSLLSQRPVCMSCLKMKIDKTVCG